MKSFTRLFIIGLTFLFFRCNAQQETSQVTQAAQAKLDSVTAHMPELMEQYKLNGLSVAVFKNYEIAWTQQWGIKAAGSTDKIEETTAFNVASISKPVVAMLCGILDEKGLINLDDPIDKYLKSWKLPESQFTKNTEVTWKHLLSHTAGTNQGGFADFYEGDTIPTIVQSLKGELLPRHGAISFLFEPGTNWGYSGGGYVIVQLALEDHLGKKLADLTKEYIFDPLGLKATTHKQPNEKGFLTNVALVHDVKGKVIRTGLPITPQVAPSGLWTTPTELAKIAIDLQKALNGKESKVVSPSVGKLVTDIVNIEKSAGYSHGWVRSFGFGNQDLFYHGGSNTGVGGEIIGTMENGNGLVIIANGEKTNRMALMNQLRKSLFDIQGWKVNISEDLLSTVPAKLIEIIEGSYNGLLLGEGVDRIFVEDKQLYMSSTVLKIIYGEEKSKIHYFGNNTFKVDNYPNFIKFHLTDTGSLTKVSIYREASDSLQWHIPLATLRNQKTALMDIFLLNNFEDATVAFRAVKAKSPDTNFQRTLTELAVMFFFEAQYELSIDILELICEENPQSTTAWEYLGEINKEIGDYEAAIIGYEKAMELSDDASYKKEIQAVVEKLKKP